MACHACAEGGVSEADIAELEVDDDINEGPDGDAAEFEAGSQPSEDDEATLDEEEVSGVKCRDLVQMHLCRFTGMLVLCIPCMCSTLSSCDWVAMCSLGSAAVAEAPSSCVPADAGQDRCCWRG